MSARGERAKARAEAEARAKAKAARATARTVTEAEEVLAALPVEPEWSLAALYVLVAISVGLLGVRFYAAFRVGFGDSEALYACWGAHPQPAFLDHPGLVGLVARVIGENTTPTPVRTHAITSIVATLVPWLVFVAGRALGAARGRAALAGLIVAVIPETAVGLFALTPDLLLAIAWLGVLALAGLAMRSTASGTRSAAAFLAAGLLAGTASAAKVSGLLLIGALLVTYLSVAFSDADQRARSAVRTIWPWAGLVAGLIVIVPIALYESKTGWPMLHHRLVATQGGAGVALRNVGALIGGQLGYLSPIFAVLAVLAAVDLVREWPRDAISRLLYLSFAVPIVPLVALCLWSPVAEPHWIAPALLALPLRVALREDAQLRIFGGRRVFVAGAALAAAFTLAAHVWVLVPEAVRLLPQDADPKLDIASELYGWPTTLAAVKEQMATAGTPFDPEGREVVIVGPHWTVCAQLQAGLPGIRVGCATPIPDDFDGWLPRDQWRAAEHVLFVTDNRFPGDGAEQLPAHVKGAQSRVRVLRGGRTARVFELYLYERRAQGLL